MGRVEHFAMDEPFAQQMRKQDERAQAAFKAAMGITDPPPPPPPADPKEVAALREEVVRLSVELRWLRESFNPKRILVEDCMRETARHFGVTRKELVSNRRFLAITRPRQVAMYVAKQVTGQSYPEIGARFGNRDHTTVLHAIRKVTALMADNEQFREDVETILRVFDGKS